ncbi:MAG: DUF2863 family protein [Burkholderiaceae bacterium]
MANKETRSTHRTRDRSAQLSPDAESMVAAALGLAHSGSRSEDRFWEAQLSRLIDRSLDSPHGSSLSSALERLNQTDGEAYAALIESAEHAAESIDEATMPRRPEAQPYFGLLVSAPLVVWTRFAIPAGVIPAPVAEQLAQIWRDLVLAPGVGFRMLPWLYSLDQMPREFSELRRLTRRLTNAARGQSEPRIDFRSLPDSAEMLADTRFLIGAVTAADPLQPLFRWQLSAVAGAGASGRGGAVAAATAAGAGVATGTTVAAAGTGQTRVQCLEQWVARARPLIEPLLPGCGFECLLPDAYHINLRESDRRVRPYAINAAVHSLTHALSIEAPRIRATIAAFGDERIDEYRIGLTVDDAEEVVRGVVWPLLGSESELDEPSPVDRIREVLREAGIEHIRVWSDVTEPEFCEDCGAPLYPNPANEIVHVETPEEPAAGNAHFH